MIIFKIMIVSLIMGIIFSFIRLLPIGFLMMEVINIKWPLSYAISLQLSSLLMPGICLGISLMKISDRYAHACIYLRVFMSQRKDVIIW